MNDPVLYSFRRCPYCIRAHMGLKKSGLKIELREVDLKGMPHEVLAIWRYHDLYINLLLSR